MTNGLPGDGNHPSTGTDGLASVLLPPVVHEASTALLVVDLRLRQVTYANDLARELAPDVPLPVTVDEWAVAAGLEDVSGSDLPAAGDETSAARVEPLLRVAAGEPVTGEAVTAARATAVTAAREPLWVLGLPLTGAPEPVSSLALVVFLPLRNARLIAGAQESASTLRQRALLATRMSFAITDPGLPDNPLVWVNPAFTETTGFGFDEAVGQNCRFLQGPATDRRQVADIRQSLDEGRPITTTILNYRKDGRPFWNELSISPVRDADGLITHFVGVQADVTERVMAQQARDAALAEVELAADRLALLADFTSRMAETLEKDEIVTLLADVLAPRLATWCAVYMLDEAGRPQRPTVRHERAEDPDVRAALARLREVVPDQLPDDGPVLAVLRRAVPHLLVPDVEDEPGALGGSTADERSLLTRELGLRSVVVVPLAVRGTVFGAVALVNDDTRRRFAEADLALMQDLAARAALMLENSRLYSHERGAAETLQRSLLPSLPSVPGLDIAAEYLPAAVLAAVGGDWYDVFPLHPGGVGIAVGDAMGHNFDSAASMGKLSTILRAYAWPGSAPHDVLGAFDALLAGTEQGHLATCFYGALELTGEGGVLRYASAGHPPALLRRPDGAVRLLDGGRGPMLGVSRLARGPQRRPASVEVALPRGSTIVCFTDGLTDAFGVDLDPDEALARLADLTGALPADASPRHLVRALLARAQDGLKDDLAVVALRVV